MKTALLILLLASLTYNAVQYRRLEGAHNALSQTLITTNEQHAAILDLEFANEKQQNLLAFEYPQLKMTWIRPENFQSTAQDVRIIP